VLEILRKFFRFCDERERSEFYRSIVLGVLAALFSALKIPAIGVMLQAILVEGVTAKTILLSLAVMLISVIGSSILKYRATALQTDGGYSTTANKRVQIAEHASDSSQSDNGHCNRQALFYHCPGYAK